MRYLQSMYGGGEKDQYKYTVADIIYSLGQSMLLVTEAPELCSAKHFVSGQLRLLQRLDLIQKMADGMPANQIRHLASSYKNSSPVGWKKQGIAHVHRMARILDPPQHKPVAEQRGKHWSGQRQ